VGDANSEKNLRLPYGLVLLALLFGVMNNAGLNVVGTGNSAFQ